MIATKDRSVITTITADVSGVENMRSETYRQDSGVPFTPRWVVLTLSSFDPAVEWTPAVKVEVRGLNILKSGQPGQQKLGCVYSSKGGEMYSHDLPLDQMPVWLQNWVQEQGEER